MVAVQQWIDSNQLFSVLHEGLSQWSNILQFIWFCLALYRVTQTALHFRLMMPRMPIMVKAYRGTDRITTWHWTSLWHQKYVSFFKPPRTSQILLANRSQESLNHMSQALSRGFYKWPKTLVPNLWQHQVIRELCLNAISLMKFQRSGWQYYSSGIHKQLHRTHSQLV